MPKVSVVIPTYNSGSYLQKAIESVLNQTFSDYEIILVDDGSTDETENIITPYLKNQKFKYFKKPHSGRSRARNFGIGVSGGEYICFLDSDDTLVENSLERRVGFAEENELNLLFSDHFCNFNGTNNQQSELAKRKKHLKFKRIGIKTNNSTARDEYIIDRNNFVKIAIAAPFNIWINTDTVFIKREFLCQNMPFYFRENMAMAEDLDFWWRILLHKKMTHLGYIDKPLAIYNIYNASWKNQNNRHYYEFTFISNLMNCLYSMPDSDWSSEIIEMSFQAMTRLPLRYHPYFYRQILANRPAKLKYWKSIAGISIKDLRSLLVLKTLSAKQ